MKKIFLLFFILLYFSKLFSQEKNFIELGFDNYHFHLAGEDIAVSPNKPYNISDVGLKIGYYRKPQNFSSFYSTFNFGFGTVDRGFPNNMNGGMDMSTYQSFFIGTTINPFKFKRFFFKIGIGINRIHIAGQEDYTFTQSSGGITFVGNGSGSSNLWAHYLNSLSSNSTKTINGYPEWERVAFGLNFGINLQLYHTFHLYFDYFYFTKIKKQNIFVYFSDN